MNKMFYSISEIGKMFGINPHVLRYWEKEFPFLSPKKNRVGKRIYTEKEIEIIKLIKHLLYDEGYTIDGARKKILRKRGSIQLRLDEEGVARFELKKVKDELRSILKKLES
ncbi:MAG TPA: MerR family transcriptional regulator [bacterium (Candidatus Stahlbacteria)]|nr:MerR family transcriptional regulator [Candidatus Stahlbacteria bacterium]